jgi:hypothetical protein
LPRPSPEFGTVSCTSARRSRCAPLFSGISEAKAIFRVISDQVPLFPATTSTCRDSYKYHQHDLHWSTGYSGSPSDCKSSRPQAIIISQDAICKHTRTRSHRDSRTHRTATLPVRISEIGEIQLSHLDNSSKCCFWGYGGTVVDQRSGDQDRTAFRLEASSNGRGGQPVSRRFRAGSVSLATPMPSWTEPYSSWLASS